MKSFTLLSLSALFAPVLCGSYEFRSCDASQQATIKAGLRDVELLSKAAAKASEGGHGKTHAWFGKPNGLPGDESLSNRYLKLSTILTRVPVKDVAFDCSATADCCSAGSSGVPACGERAGEKVISICRPFWNWHIKQRVYELAAPSGPTNEAIQQQYRTYGYILLHELSHSLYETGDKKYQTTDKDGNKRPCSGYGQYCVLKLAQQDPYNARRNADTFALFAVAAYYGINKFQTNPDLVVGI